MKTKYLLLVLAALLTAGALWAGRVAWRVQRQLVTLDVRNAPVADVLRKIEHQTWKKFRAEKLLDARITLHVTNQPLRDVLDRIAEQAGARWSTVYAVYDSAAALSSLDTSLRGDGKVELAGWTRIAPKMPEFDPAEPGENPVVLSSSNGTNLGPEVAFRRALPSPSEDPDAEPPPIMPPGGRRMMVRRDSNGVTLAQGPDGRSEMWSPEELIMESALNARLGTATEQPPTKQAAEETARQVKGKWTSYIAFRKSIMGVGFSGHAPGRPGADPLGRGPNGRFARLTPEQRVQQVRERRGLNAKGEMINQ